MERAILVGVNLGMQDSFERSMKELRSLAEACDMEVVGVVTQNLPSVNKALYIGNGKVEEVAQLAAMQEADVVIFDNPLSPAQLGNLKEELHLAVLDRTNLILQIFSDRARTREAKLQVEVANLQYLLPRLVGAYDALSRQGGGSGSMSNKGAGEKKIELDRRRIEKRLTLLRQELKEMEGEREVQRKGRLNSDLPIVALVGYTNAGKSSLMNAMLSLTSDDVDKQVFEKDMLFATLDTTVRKIVTPQKKNFLLTDTVGFIDNLPHQLVKAFRSTLEEVKNADLLLHIVDASDPDYKEHYKVTIDTLHELGADDIRRVTILNKCDLADHPSTIAGAVMQYDPRVEQKIYLSAKNEKDVEELIAFLCKAAYPGDETYELLIPFTDGNVFSYLKDNTTIFEQRYEAEGIYVKASLSAKDAGRFQKYVL